MQQPVGVQCPGVIEMHLSVGGVSMVITARESDLALTVPAAVARFMGNHVPQDTTPDIKVSAQWATSQRPINGRLIFDSGGLWRLHEEDDKLSWSFTSPRFGVTPYKTAVFERDFSAGQVYLHRPYFDASIPIYPMEYPLDELVLTNWLALGRGIEIHGCGVRDSDGAGYLFTGHSGAGKTTIARLWKDLPGVTVLSDDRIILRRVGGKIFMHGTPWHGDEPLASPLEVALTRGYVLHHAPRNESVELSGVDVVAKLMARSFPPFFSATALDFTLSFLSGVSECAPFFDLRFVPSDDLPDFVRDAATATVAS